jgi:signal transduction histidine kinase
LQVFLGTFVLSLLIRLSSIPGDPQDPFWLSVVVTLVTQTTSYIWLLVVTRPLSKLKGKWVYLAAISVLAVGVIRGLVIQGLITENESFLTFKLLNRIASGTVVVGFGNLAISYVVGVMAKRISILRDLRLQQNELYVALATNQATVDNWLDTLVGDVKKQLRTALGFKKKMSGKQLSESVNRVINDLVRPLSYHLTFERPENLVVQQAATTNQSIVRDLLRSSLNIDFQTKAWAVAVLGFFWTIVPAQRIFGFSRIYLVLIPVAIVWISYWATGHFINRIKATGSVVARLALYLLLLTLAAYPAALLALSQMSYGDDEEVELFAAETSIALALISMTISLSIATYHASLNDQRQLENVALELKWLVARTRAQMWELQRSVSKVLHGPVQSSLSAAAIRLDMAAKDTEVLPQIVEESKASISAAIEELSAPIKKNQSLRAGLEQVSQGWNGICSVSVRLPNEIETRIEADSSASRVALDIAQEAISNAVRHGGASVAEVTLESSGESEITLTVRNDGKPAPHKIKIGLGTNLLEECTLSWSRISDSLGTTLTCRLPVSR